MRQSHHKRFPAVLKTPEGRLLEYGNACVSVEERQLDFTGEFVPIFKMGTPLSVVHVQKIGEEEQEIQRFSGEVYLSSQHLLRLVSLADEVLPGAAFLGPYDTTLKGRATGTIQPVETGKHFSLRHKPQPAPYAQTFPITIHALSMTGLHFTCEKELAEGQQLKVDIAHPISLHGLPVTVDLPIFGPNAACSYRCSIGELDGSNRAQLEPFAFRLSRQAMHLFPPAGSDAPHPPATLASGEADL